jgi:hypothetical protein
LAGVNAGPRDLVKQSTCFLVGPWWLKQIWMPWFRKAALRLALAVCPEGRLRRNPKKWECSVSGLFLQQACGYSIEEISWHPSSLQGLDSSADAQLAPSDHEIFVGLSHFWWR